MADPVAIVSVLSSAAIAGGTLWVNFQNSTAQRTHERALAYEGRVWEKKSEALYAVITSAAPLDASVRDMDPVDLALLCSDALEVCDQHVGVVEAFAPEPCRRAFGFFHAALRRSGAPGQMRWRINQYRLSKETAIDDGDFDAAHRIMTEERGLQDEAREKLNVDRENLMGMAYLLVEESRAALGAIGAKEAEEQRRYPWRRI